MASKVRHHFRQVQTRYLKGVNCDGTAEVLANVSRDIVEGPNRRKILNFYYQLTSQILQKLTRILSQRVPPGGSGAAETI